MSSSHLKTVVHDVHFHIVDDIIPQSSTVHNLGAVVSWTTVSTSGFPEATNVPVTEPFQWLLHSNGTPFPFTFAVLLLSPYSNLILKLTFIHSLFFVCFVVVSSSARCILWQRCITNTLYFYYYLYYYYLSVHRFVQA